MTGHTRNHSPYEMFRRIAASRAPRFSFDGSIDFDRWKAEATAAVVASLGRLPEAVEPRAELIAETTFDDVVSQRWLIDVQEHLSCIAYVNRPACWHPGDPKLPGLLCWHGHGPVGFPAGKEPMMGNESTPELVALARRYGAYGKQMAAAGYATFAVDWLGNGTLYDAVFPNNRNVAAGRDWCDLYYLTATLLGTTPLGLNLVSGLRLVDLAQGLPFIDPDRIGAMGLSCGGTHALWSGLVDARIRAVEIICYSDLFCDFAIRDLNFCGSQVTPGLFELVDVPDLQGLLAPRPLLIDIGVYDDCFRVESALACHERVSAVYEAADAQAALTLNLFAGGHEWEGGGSIDFFAASLAVS
jgi:hypothetical protein